MKKIIPILLLFMLLLPRMLFTAAQGYEIILKEPIKISDTTIRQSTMTPTHVAFLSDSQTMTIHDQSMKLIHIKGDLSHFLKKDDFDTTFDTDNRLYLSKAASQKLFFTENAKGNVVSYKTGSLTVKDTIDTRPLYFNESVDGYLTTKEDPKIKRIYTSGYLGDKTMDSTMLSSYLSSLGVTEYTVNSLKKLNHTRYQEIIFLESITVLMLLIIISRDYVKDRQQLTLVFIFAFIFLLMRIPYAHWPLHLIDEKLVSLTAYINGIKAMPMKLFEFLSKEMSFMIFKEKLILLLQPLYYLIVGTMIMKGIKK